MGGEAGEPERSPTPPPATTIHACQIKHVAQYDVIVLDETQDFNPCQYDAFVYQEPRCVRYLLGDEFPRVYGFRDAREDFEACHVSSGLLPDDVTKLLKLFFLFTLATCMID